MSPDGSARRGRREFESSFASQAFRKFLQIRLDPVGHILKPPAGEFDGHAENEHLCLLLARSVDLPAASSETRRFEDQVAIVVERYDRIRMDRTIGRVHQEDVCQALGLSPTKKYQSGGGPGVREMAELLTTFSTAPA
jgi:serine/threonine-protein kinase HipA